MSDVYLDSDDRALQKAGMVCRRRDRGDRVVITVKGRGGEATGGEARGGGEATGGEARGDRPRERRHPPARRVGDRSAGRLAGRLAGELAGRRGARAGARRGGRRTRCGRSSKSGRAACCAPSRRAAAPWPSSRWTP